MINNLDIFSSLGENEINECDLVGDELCKEDLIDKVDNLYEVYHLHDSNSVEYRIFGVTKMIENLLSKHGIKWNKVFYKYSDNYGFMTIINCPHNDNVLGKFTVNDLQPYLLEEGSEFTFAII